MNNDNLTFEVDTYNTFSPVVFPDLVRHQHDQFARDFSRLYDVRGHTSLSGAIGDWVRKWGSTNSVTQTIVGSQNVDSMLLFVVTGAGATCSRPRCPTLMEGPGRFPVARGTCN